MANTLHVAVDHHDDARPGEPGYDAFHDLWGRLARPFDVVATVSALTGIAGREVERLVGLAVSTSAEAEQLLDAFPHTVRSLATSMQTQAERCVGEVRGPVLWSETISARAASFGNPDVYICATPSRAYDIEENQVLVWALRRVREASDAALADLSVAVEDRQLRRARRNGLDAGRFAEHPSLARVTRRLPGPRAIRKIRTGKKKRAYEPALQMLERLAVPLEADDVLALCDERTRAQHALLMAIVHGLEARTENRLPEFRIEKGALYSGPLQYHHGGTRGGSRTLSGIVVGSLLVDVPDRLHDPSRARAQAALEARAGRRRALVVLGPDEIDVAIDQAIDLARGE